MGNYHLIMKPTTFLWIKKEKGCIYNTLNGGMFRFINHEPINTIVGKLLDRKSLYQIVISENEFNNEIIKKWINGIISIDAGKIVNDENYQRTASFLPEFKIRDNIESYKSRHEMFRDSNNIMNNIHNLIFYINGSKYGNSNYFKQINYPMLTSDALSINHIDYFVRNSRKSDFLNKITLVGDLWNYSGKERILKIADEYGYSVKYCCLDKDVINSFEHLDYLLNNNVFLQIIVSDHDLTEGILLKIKKENSILFAFVISCEDDLYKAEGIIDKYGLTNFELIPICTENNLRFIENNLYLSKEDIGEIKLSKREIFAHQVLNTHDFGVLTIAPDGAIYSNTCNSPIGHVEEAPHDIVFREITEGKSWFRIRDQKPCCDCIYQWLCPSPSNYELVIGKPNLCRITVD